MVKFVVFVLILVQVFKLVLKVEVKEVLEFVEEDKVIFLCGLLKIFVVNMDEFLIVLIVISVCMVLVKLMIDNCIVINNYMVCICGGKVSFIYFIGWVFICIFDEFCSQNVFYVEIDGKLFVVVLVYVNFGIVIDFFKLDGICVFMVFSIKCVDMMIFIEYFFVYEDLVICVWGNKFIVVDFQGIIVLLINLGGIGIVYLVFCFMKGQGCIIGVGVFEYFVEFQGVSEKMFNEFVIGKMIIFISIYDYCVIQGVGFGEFLKKVYELFIGQCGFYDDIFVVFCILYVLICWNFDIVVDFVECVDKQFCVQEFINFFCVCGYLMVDIDLFEYWQCLYFDLEIESYGFIFWDLDCEFVIGGFGGCCVVKFCDIFGVLCDLYCCMFGIEYMYIQDLEQCCWFQEKVEVKYQKFGYDEQLCVLCKFNEVEVFEIFLQIKFVGQKCFFFEGGELLILLFDEVFQGVVIVGFEGVVIGMVYCGCLNVFINIVGKIYGQVFCEFEGMQMLGNQCGFGDVKYYFGIEGIFVVDDGFFFLVYFVVNFLYFEMVDGVLEGIVCVKQDCKLIGIFVWLLIFVYGDVVFVGQGVVVEMLQMLQLCGYCIGGMIYVVVNNQVGFIMMLNDGCILIYLIDVVKMIQVLVFYVNGDDFEVVIYVVQFVFEYCECFYCDVVIDFVCYC